MARFFYRLLLALLVPALVVRLLWRARRQPEYLDHLAERFGRYRSETGPLASATQSSASAPAPLGAPIAEQPLLWLHAVSVGETRAAQPLIAGLIASHPEHRLLITCMTPTGRAAATELYGHLATVLYLPYDFAGAQRRFLKHFKPRLGVLLETELWPNLLYEARAARVPMVLVNARLSVRSARGYRRIGALIRPALTALTAVAAQTRADADRLTLIGTRPPVISGNLKFEVLPDPEKLQLGKQWRQTVAGRLVWLAASTRDGEEALILDAFAQLLNAGEENLLLVLVPRHPQRFDEVASLIEKSGLRLTRRSDGQPDATTQVWLGNSMGEMAAYYAMADLCVMGGSLLPYGSQNLIEACACECPVLIGPSDFNFRQAASDALAAGAAKRVIADTKEISGTLCAAVLALAHAPQHLASMRRACIDFSGAHRGATLRTLAVLEKVLSRPTSAPPPGA